LVIGHWSQVIRHSSPTWIFPLLTNDEGPMTSDQ
jgi:hypothetical protein